MSEFQSDDFKLCRRVVVQRETPPPPRGFGPLLLSLALMLPAAPLVAVFWALSLRRANARLHGAARSPLTACAIVVGLLLTLVQGFAVYRGVECLARQSIGPTPTLAAGFRGDTSTFTRGFVNVPEDATLQATAFIQQLRERFGEFKTAIPTGTSPDGSTRTFELVFERAVVDAEALTALDPTIGIDWMRYKLESIVIRDPQHGALSFPTDSTRMLSRQPDANPLP